MAVMAEEFFGGTDKKFRIFATDINTLSLNVLRKGEYSNNSFRNDGSSFHDIFRKYCTKTDDTWKVGSAINEKIEIIPYNLLQDDFADIPDCSVHTAFFRNTLIYMKNELKQNVLKNVLKKIVPGGFLFLSSAEIPSICSSGLKIIENNGIYYFQKLEKVDKTYNSPPDYTGPKVLPDDGLLELDKVLELCGQFVEFGVIGDSGAECVRYQEISSLILEIIFLINKNQLLKARESLEKLEKSFSSNYLTLYLYGLIEMHSMDMRRAANNFEKSISMNNCFWPAHFYLASISNRINPGKAFVEYNICMDLLKQNSKSLKRHYNFLIENFDEMYFYEMCEKWINKLKGVGV